jgi:hypothetical protein
VVLYVVYICCISRKPCLFPKGIFGKAARYVELDRFFEPSSSYKAKHHCNAAWRPRKERKAKLDLKTTYLIESQNFADQQLLLFFLMRLYWQ